MDEVDVSSLNLTIRQATHQACELSPIGSSRAVAIESASVLFVFSMPRDSSNQFFSKSTYDSTLETESIGDNKMVSHISIEQQKFVNNTLQSKVGINLVTDINTNRIVQTNSEHSIDTKENSCFPSCPDQSVLSNIMSDKLPPSIPVSVNNAKFDLIFKLVNDGHITPDKFNTENESLLGIACSTGHFNLVRLLIQKGADVNYLGANGEHTPLMEAINSNSVKMAQLLINHNANVNAKSKSGYTALHIACASGNLACTKLLIESGADPTICSALLRTPVMEAAFCGHSEIIAYLLDESPKTINSTECLSNCINNNNNNINNNNLTLQQLHCSSSSSVSAQNSTSAGCTNDNFFKMCHINFRESPLLIASHRGHADAVRVILERIHYMVNPEEDIMSSILEATIDCHVHVVEYLLDFASKNFDIDEALNSPLTLAASGGHLGLVKLFVDYGANPNDFNAEGFTPLMEACREGHLDVIKYFLSPEVGAKIDTITKEHGETALTISCCSGNIEAVKHLVEVGKASLELGHSPPLLEAASENHADIVEYLINKGASIQSKGSVGRDALYQACEAGNMDVVRVLLKYGADIENFADDYKTPLMRAVESGHIDIVEYLLLKGARINAKNPKSEWTALTIACLSGNVIMARYLVACGADPRAKMSDNSNLLIEATRAGHLNIVAFLLNPSVNTPQFQPNCINHPGSIAQSTKVALTTVASSQSVPSPTTSSRISTIGDNKLPLVCWQHESSETERLKTLIPPRILDFYMKSNKITDRNVACDSMAAAFQSYSKKLFNSVNSCNDNQTSQCAGNSQDKHIKNVHHLSDKSSSTSCGGNNTIKKPTRMCEYHNLIDSMSSFDWNNLPNELLALSNSVEINDLNAASGDNQSILENHLKNISTATIDKNNNPNVASESDNSGNCFDSQRNISLLNLLEHLSLKGSKLVSPVIAQSDDYFNMATSSHLTSCANNSFDGDHNSIDCCCLASYASKYLQMSDVGSNITDNCMRNVFAKINKHFKHFANPFNDVNQRTDSGKDSSLSIASSMGYLEIVEYLVKNNASINILDHNGYSPLMAACAGNHFHVANYFLSLKDVDVNIKSDGSNDTALTLASAAGRIDVVEKLLDHGCKVEHKNSNDFTPLCLAAQNGHLEVAKLLLTKNAKVNCNTALSPLVLAVMNGHHRVAELLIKYKADVNVVVESNGSTPLSIAIYANKAGLADLLLRNGASPDFKNKVGFTPFMDAASSNNVAIGKILLDHNCDAASTSSLACRENAMLLSAEKGHNEFMELLLKRKFPVDCRNKKGQTPSWISATNGFLSCLILLYDYKANIDLPDYSGVTPLLSAFRNCHIEVVEWLVSKVDQLPPLNVCRKHIAKSSPSLKTKYEHTFDILSNAINRKSQIAEMNANRLLLEEERVKNKKKKKRKSKKPNKPSKESDPVVTSKTQSPTTKPQPLVSSETAVNSEDEPPLDIEVKSVSLEVGSVKSANENTSEQLSGASSCDESESDGWISNQQQQSQHQQSQTTNLSTTTHYQHHSQTLNVSSVKKPTKPLRINVDKSESITETIYINRNSVSRTIGRNGSTISAIKYKTLTYIDIDTVSEFDGGRLCKTVIVGKKEGVQQAIRILRSVESNNPSVVEELSPFLGEYAQFNFSPQNQPSNNSTSSQKVSHESSNNTCTHKKAPQISVSTRSPSTHKYPSENVIVSSSSVANQSADVSQSASDVNLSSIAAGINADRFQKSKSTLKTKEVVAPLSSDNSNLSLNTRKTQKLQTITKTTTAISKDNNPRSRKTFSNEKSSPGNFPTHYVVASGTKGKSKTSTNTLMAVENSRHDDDSADVDISWFHLLNSSEYLSLCKLSESNTASNTPASAINEDLNDVKNSFPQSLNESTFYGFPCNERAFATLNQSSQNDKLIPGRGRRGAPVSRLGTTNYTDAQSILQHAHDKYPSFVSTIDHEALLRVTNSVAKEVTSISNDAINDISNFSQLHDENMSTSQLLECFNFNSLGFQTSAIDPVSSVASQNSLHTSSVPSGTGTSLNLFPRINPGYLSQQNFSGWNRPFASTNTHRFSSDTSIPKSSSITPIFGVDKRKNDTNSLATSFIPITPVIPVSSSQATPTVGPHLVIPLSNLPYMQGFNSVRPVNFVGHIQNFPNPFHYVNDSTIVSTTNDPSVINNNNSRLVSTSILAFLETYNLMDLYEHIRYSVNSLDELISMNDNQLLDINIPVRYIQTLRIAMNDYLHSSANTESSNNFPRNSRGYNFYHSEYNS